MTLLVSCLLVSCVLNAGTAESHSQNDDDHQNGDSSDADEQLVAETLRIIASAIALIQAILQASIQLPLRLDSAVVVNSHAGVRRQRVQ